ncbi:MAG TPA: hypothetical protein VIR60_00420 [Gammaproteobacteria bacterium]
MLKWTLIGGLLALFGFTGLTLGNLVYAIVGLGIGFTVLAIVLEIAAVVLERSGRRWGGIHHHGFTDRFQRSRPLT